MSNQNSKTMERDPLDLVPGIRLPPNSQNTWTTFVEHMKIKDPAGTTIHLTQDAAGQSYLDIPTASSVQSPQTRIFIPLSAPNLERALTGEDPLRTILLEADWVYLTHNFADRNRPAVIIMATPKTLAENRHAAPLLPPVHTKLSIDKKTCWDWQNDTGSYP